MGIIETKLKHKLYSLDDLSLVYTPGVSFSSKEIHRDKNIVNTLTNRKNSIAVIWDCTENPESYLPYVEIVAAIIKNTTYLDAYPMVSLNYDINKIIDNLEPSFAGFYIFSKQNIVKNNTIVTHEFEYDENIIIKNTRNLISQIKKSISNLPEYDNNEFRTKSLKLREKLKGVIETNLLTNNFKLNKKYTTNIIEKIKQNPQLAYEYTIKQDTIAIISDGSAVLGLGNIGAYAALPVMEGKAAIFKELGGINAVPICLKTQNIDEIIDISGALSHSFGGINLEDINAPRCFEVEEKLTEKTNIPIFHDDQHGTAIIVLAGLLNALKLAKKDIKTAKIVISGAGAAAQAVAKLIIKAGAKNLIMRDIDGVISLKSAHKDKYLKEMAKITNPNCEDGSLADILVNADVLIGLSTGNIVTESMIKSMNKKPIVFVLANPTPEIMPDLAKKAGAYIVATGRSDFENQINNSLAFPGIFKGLLSKNIKKVTPDIKYKVALAIAEYSQKELSVNKILPKALDKNIVEEIVNAL